MPPEQNFDYNDHQSQKMNGSYYSPSVKYSNNWQSPVKSNSGWATPITTCVTPVKNYDSCLTPVIKHDSWSTPTVSHRVRFKSAHQLLEERTISSDSAFEGDASSTEHYPDSSGQPPSNPYYPPVSHLKVQNRDFPLGEGNDLRDSTGSDSGVHSNNSPCPDTMSPTLSHRHTDQSLVSIHELDQSHVSISSKKVRNETYV